MAGNHKHERSTLFSKAHPMSDEDHGETFRGYSLSTERMGSATNPGTEMQVTEVESRLREGMKVVEAGMLDIRRFESIPTEHFRDMKRLANLAGAEVTMHAPLINPAGFQGDRWGGEEARETAERQFKSVIAKSLEANPQGNIPIVIHAAGDGSTPANIFERGPKGEFEKKAIFVVNQINGSTEQIVRDDYGNKHETPEEILKKKNIKSWRETLSQVQESMAKRDEFDRELNLANEIAKKIDDFNKTAGKQLSQEEMANKLTYDERRILGNTQENFRRRGIYDSLLKDNVEAITKISVKLGREESKKIAARIDKIYSESDDPHGDALKFLIEKEIKEGFRPEILKPIEEFSKERVAETFSNLAVWAKDYAEKKGYKAPTIVAENFFPETAFSTADSMKDLIEESRKMAEEQLIAKGMSASAAKREAEILIGVTWDVGHINNFKKFGFKDEDIIKETEKISKYVKHLHMHDNLGMEPSHLAVGMGNVPLKGILNALREEGYDGRAILEGGAAAATFKTSDFRYSLQSLDAPIYGAGTAGAGWGNVQGYSSHFSGYGSIFPEQHFAMYGGGFSQLPTELGGKAGGKGSRFSGTPTE